MLFSLYILDKSQTLVIYQHSFLGFPLFQITPRLLHIIRSSRNTYAQRSGRFVQTNSKSARVLKRRMYTKIDQLKSRYTDSFLSKEYIVERFTAEFVPFMCASRIRGYSYSLSRFGVLMADRDQHGYFGYFG